MEAIRVLFVDDHPIVRQGLVSLMRGEDDIVVVGEASDGDEAIVKAAELKPSMIIMDIGMPNMSGLHAARAILKQIPATKVIVLSMSDDAETVEQALQVGVSAYIVKQSVASELLTAIREVNQGNAFFSPSVSKVILSLHSNGRTGERGLTLREREVLQLIAEGKSNKQISTQLVISVKTVEKYRQQIMEKLDIHEVVGLTRFAIAKGISKL